MCSPGSTRRGSPRGTRRPNACRNELDRSEAGPLTRLRSMLTSMAPESGLAFDQNRARLWRVAYRMLGSRADADDVVQEAWLRWHDSPVEDIRAPQAWLMTTTTR